MNKRLITVSIAAIFAFKITTSFCQSDTDVDKTLKDVSADAIKVSK